MFKVLNLNDESINFLCVVGLLYVIILVLILVLIVWNLFKYFIEFLNIIINIKLFIVY